jgi:hypothetical protein
VSTYRERREARAARLRQWADGNADKADAALADAEQRASVIPFGQPILVGHHSEGRDRRYREGIGRKMDQGVQLGRKADDQARRADEIERQARLAIYDDDPDACERLADKIAQLEDQRMRIKAYNASCRKANRTGNAPDASLLTEAQQRELLTLTRIGHLGKGGTFPAYVAGNLTGNIGRLRKRLANLQAAGSGPERRKPNRYPGTCEQCGDHVAADAGVVVKQGRQPWLLFCAEHQEAPE